MRFANPHPPRHGAFLLIALFSCLQILFGFFLFTGNESDSVLPARKSMQIASHEEALQLNAIETASGHHDTTSYSKLSLSQSCNGCGTFSYFDKYRKKAKELSAAHQHAASKKRIQQKHRQYMSHPVIADNSDYKK